MRVLIKTREELLYSGWIVDRFQGLSSYDTNPCVPQDMLHFLGTIVEVYAIGKDRYRIVTTGTAYDYYLSRAMFKPTLEGRVLLPAFL